MTTLNERPDVHIASPISLRQAYQQPQKESRARSLRHVIVVTGPAGCGKSSVAEFLASAMGLPYIEGDNVCSHLIEKAHQQDMFTDSFYSSTVPQTFKRCRVAPLSQMTTDGTG